MDKTIANLNIELYEQDGLKCAYIGDDKGGSGISVKEETVEALATSVAEYIKDYFG